MTGDTGTGTYDIAIIGGGILGLATAMELSGTGGHSVVVVEAEDRVAPHQTGNNSGVVHSGLYYKPGSLKATNCTIGREQLYDFCDRNDIPYERCGKLVVATREEELPLLEKLEERGRANGLKGIKRLKPQEIGEHEPAVSGVGGLLVPETGIVDYVKVTETFSDIFRENGGQVRLKARVTKIHKNKDEIILHTSAGDIACRNLINCAGLQSDRIARMSGVNPGLKIIPFRGEYYDIKKERESLVRNLIYPVPDPQFPFLGVHFTRRIGGGVEAGPNAVLSFKREGYRKISFSLKDSFSAFTYKGFWVMALKHWQMGVGEFYRSFFKSAFVKALQRLIPEIAVEDLVPGGAGVRAQALEPDGFLVDDFRIKEAPHMVHVLNAPSPAATASINIGKSIAAIARKNFA